MTKNYINNLKDNQKNIERSQANLLKQYLQQQDEQVLESFFNKLKAFKDLPAGCMQAIDEMRRDGFPFQKLDDAMARNFGLNPEEVYREKELKLLVGRIQGKLDQGQSFKEAFDGLNAKEFQNLAEVFNASPAPYLTRYV